MLKRKTLHALLLVGYGLKNDMDFYWVKNSCGASWDQTRYERFCNAKGHTCLTLRGKPFLFGKRCHYSFSFITTQHCSY